MESPEVTISGSSDWTNAVLFLVNLPLCRALPLSPLLSPLYLHNSLSPSLHVSLHCLLVFNFASIVFGQAHFLKRKSIAHIHHTSIMLDGDVGMLYI